MEQAIFRGQRLIGITDDLAETRGGRLTILGMHQVEYIPTHDVARGITENCSYRRTDINDRAVRITQRDQVGRIADEVFKPGNRLARAHHRTVTSVLINRSDYRRAAGHRN